MNPHISEIPSRRLCDAKVLGVFALALGWGGGCSGSAVTAPPAAADGGAVACQPGVQQQQTPTHTALRLAVEQALPPGSDSTLCLRYTTPVSLDLTGVVGHLGAGGHHALLLALAQPAGPDGLSPCSESQIMDARNSGVFSMLAGVSYESSDLPITFPAVPVQVGLRVAAGTQLVLDTHFVNAQATATTGCTTLQLNQDAPVVAAMVFRTVIPKEEYTLTIPAGQTVTVSYDEPVGDKYRVAAASSHMHAGALHFKMTVKESGQLLYEATSWSEPKPAQFDQTAIVVQPSQTFHIECTFQNLGATDQHFPDQMCVGGMYLLPCVWPGEC